MLWDIGNTILEFVIIYNLFHLLTDHPINGRESILYAFGSIVLSVFFCIDIPHYVLLNVGLFILLQLLCFYKTEIHYRVSASIETVFLTLSLEMMLLSLLPEKLFHTFLGDSIINILLFIITGILFLYARRKHIATDLCKLIYHFRYRSHPMLILYVSIFRINQKMK